MSALKILKEELENVVIGHNELIEELLVALLCRGHILIEGVPGLAKTTAVKLLAKCCGVEFKRVQFTPDLMPSDILGSEIYDPKEGIFRVKKGPVFTNMLLSDEINRSPAKVQSALLEVMEERQVTIGEHTFFIEPPFMVLATQNPIESQGAYELPEAQLDRFLFKSIVNYNTKNDELLIVKKAIEESFSVKKVIEKDEILRLQDRVKSIHADKEVEEYAINIVDATRNPKEYGLERVAELIEYGSGTRGSIGILKAARAFAMLDDREFITPLDIKRVAKPALRHRIILSYQAEAEDVKSDEILEQILEQIDVP